MADISKIIIPHPDEQRTYAELREEFRASSLESLRAQMFLHPSGWMCIGDPEKTRFIVVNGKFETRYTSEQWAKEMLAHLDAPVVQDFGLAQLTEEEKAATEEEIARWAKDSIFHTSATWPEGTEGVSDREAPTCADVRTMADDELSEYVDRSIRESARG